MKRTLQLATIILLLIGSNRAFAQQDPQFTQYMYNGLFNNPANSGIEGVTKFTAIGRTQWLGYVPTQGGGGAPNTQLVTLSAPFMSNRVGFGFEVVNDKLGAQSNLQIQASGAYHLGIDDTKLSFGVRVGMFSQTIDGSLYEPIQTGDPVIINGKPTQVRPDVSVGVNFRAEKFYLGASFNHLIEAKFDFGSDPLRNSLERNLVFTGGYFYEFSYDWTFSPALILKSDLKTLSFDISAIATYKNKMWGGLSFRQQEGPAILLGYSFFKENQLKVGYAMDYTLFSQEAKAPTSHELMVSYTLPAISTNGKKVVRTPRFRH